MTVAADPKEPLERDILAYAFGDDGEVDTAKLAERLARYPDSIGYIFRIIDDVSALHTLAGSKLAVSEPPGLDSLKRLNALLDDVMVLLAERQGGPSGAGGGTEEAIAGGKRAVPVGED